ncbi:SpoIIE family protein phosphatase [Streptomyces sp. NPDC002004]
MPLGPRLEAAFAGLEAGMVLTDPGGRITMVNPAAERILARAARALVGTDAHDLLHRSAEGSLLPRAECEILAVMSSGRPRRGGFGMFLDGNGHLVPVDWSAAPVLQDGSTSGAAVLFTDATERLAVEQRQAHHLAALEELTERLTLLTEISTALTRPMDAEEAARQLGALLVPHIAEWAAVDLRGRYDALHRIVVLAPEGMAADDTWQGPLPPVPEASRSHLARVLRRGDSALLGPDEIGGPTDCALASVQSTMFRSFATTSAIIAPLRSPREVLGALTVGRSDVAHPFDTAELMLITDIGRRAGLIMDNARLFGQQRDIAATLQRHMLSSLPRLENLQLAARYLPAPAGAQVGGDWYDAFSLADGVTALVIGDVSGHDLPAAAGMAQLRNMLRSLAWDRVEPPSLIVDRLDRALPAIADVPMASLVLARIEGPVDGAWRLRFCNAGHPPPLLIGHDGDARYLNSTENLLLGTRLPGVPARADSSSPLPSGCTLLLYTDGLVESPDEDLDTGLERLRRHGAALAHHPLEDFCDEVLSRMGHTGHDDTALLALRLPRTGADAV